MYGVWQAAGIGLALWFSAAAAALALWIGFSIVAPCGFQRLRRLLSGSRTSGLTGDDFVGAEHLQLVLPDEPVDVHEDDGNARLAKSRPTAAKIKRTRATGRSWKKSGAG